MKLPFLTGAVAGALSLLALLPGTTARAQAPASRGMSFVRDSLDTYVNREMKRWGVPGVAVLVVKDGRVLHMRGYGTTAIKGGTPVDTNTLFMIGSNTKAFVGTSLAMLEAEGKCQLSDPVRKYYPGFKLHDEYRAANASLSDVVSHQLGFETFQGDFMYWGSDMNSQQCLEKFGKLPPLHGFRSKWGYTNMGYVVAAEAIKNMSGMTWADYVRQRILTPLNMKNTVVTIAELDKVANKTAAHTVWDGQLMQIPYGRFENLGPAASISSSVADMSHWLLAQLDSGKYQGKRVIPYKAIQRSRTPFSINGRVRARSYSTHYTLYGLGWELQDANGKEIVAHTGGVDGYVTSVTMIPEERLGFVVLTNTDQNMLFNTLKMELIDAFLNVPYRGYSQLYYNRAYVPGQKEEAALLARQRDTIAQRPAVSLGLPAYIGTYEHPVYGTVQVKQQATPNVVAKGKAKPAKAPAPAPALVMSFENHSRLSCLLEPLGGSRFLATYSDPLYGRKVFTFKTGNNRVESFDLLVADFLEFTPYTFMKR